MVKEYSLHLKDEADTTDLYPQWEDDPVEDLMLFQTAAVEPLAVDSLRAILRPDVTQQRQTAQGPCALDELHRIYD